MGCGASSGVAPHEAAWAATGALCSTGQAVDAPSLNRIRPLPVATEPEPEPEPSSPASQIALGDLEELCILGVGSFGEVSLVRHRLDGRTYGEKTHRLRRQSATVAYRVDGVGSEVSVVFPLARLSCELLPRSR